jgi:hypothetical protein
MPVPRRLLPTLATLLALATLDAPPAHAQQPGSAAEDDGRWFVYCSHRDGDDVRRCVLRERGLRPTGALDVDPGRNGGVSLNGWDRDSVHVRARIETQAPTEAEAAALAERVRIVTEGGHVRAEGPPEREHAFWSVSFEIWVPARSNLAATTYNGPIEVNGVSGRIRLSAVNGPMSLARVGGDVVARTRNGPLSVDLDGPRWNGKGLDAETENGPIVLAIPRDYSARLETGTLTGPLDVHVPLTVTLGDDEPTLRRFVTTLGSGGPPVRVVTTNGPVSIQR